jgi:hypothetical protein
MQVNLERSVLKVLAYFDMFNYPLLREEVHFFLDRHVSADELQKALKQLMSAHCIYRHGDFYSLNHDRSLVARRIKGNQKAGSLLTTAYKVSAFLYRFPFVRGVGISGSLSKNFAGERDDIDFFIITKANRLWIARTLMHLFKKLTFLAGRQHWFCMNYFVDEEAMLIEERNVFTATELLTLVPVAGNGTLDNFFHVNAWAMDYFPNATRRSNRKKYTRFPWYKKFAEWIFSNRLGDKLDNFLMKLTSRRWKKKEEAYRLNMKGNRMGLRNDKHYSKPNPQHFQEKLLEVYWQKLKKVEEKWQVPDNVN